MKHALLNIYSGVFLKINAPPTISPEVFGKLFNLKHLFIIVLLVLFHSTLFGQVAGDYRSLTSGNWNAFSTWERHDGVGWVAATTGQTPGAATNANVLIRDNHTVTANVSVSTNPLASLTIGEGTSGILEYYNSGTAVTLIVGTTTAGTGNVTVASGAIFRANASASVNGTHTFTMGGSIAATFTNNGTVDFYVPNGSFTSQVTFTVNKTLGVIVDMSGTPTTNRIGSLNLIGSTTAFRLNTNTTLFNLTAINASRTLNLNGNKLSIEGTSYSNSGGAGFGIDGSVSGSTLEFTGTSSIAALNVGVLTATLQNFEVNKSLSTASITLATTALSAVNIRVKGGILNTALIAITGNASGVFVVESGATFTTTKTTTPWFATNTPVANFTIDNNSTINLNGAANTTYVSTDIPTTYGHLNFGGSGTHTLPKSITVNGNFSIAGTVTVADNGFQIVGNSSNNFTMGTGTGLTLGVTGTATAFPTNFINSKISLHANSTVTYSSNQAQTISSVPDYGGLSMVATAGVTKTLQGSITVAGALSNGVNNTVTDGSNNYVVTVAGAITSNGTITGETTVLLDGGTAHNISGIGTYRHLTLDDATGTLNGATNISGNLTVTSGNFTAGAFILAVSGATTIANGATLTINSTTGAKSFNDITNNGTWTVSGAVPFTIAGSLAHNGTTFTSSTGVYTFTGSSKTIGGSAASLSITSATVTGSYSSSHANMSIATLTINSGGSFSNTGTLTVATALNTAAGSGTFTNGSNSTLILSGTSLVTTLDAATNPNVVIYNLATAQTIKSTTYDSLVINKNAVANTASLGNVITVRSLNILMGTLQDQGYQITGNASGTLNASANGRLIIGLTAAATIFPTNFINSRIALDDASIVTYQSTSNQNVSHIPNYGNLTVVGVSIKTITNNTVVKNDFTVTSGTFSPSTYTLEVRRHVSNSGTIDAAAAGKILLDGGTSHDVGGTGGYGNLQLDDANAVTTANTTINGNLIVTSGAFTIGNFTFTNAATKITNIFGTLTKPAGTGALSFGDLDIESGGTFSIGSNPAVTINGSLTNDGSFTSGTGAYGFAGASKTISGTALIPVNGAITIGTTGSYTNSATLNATSTFLISNTATSSFINNKTLYVAGQLTVGGNVGGSLTNNDSLYVAYTAGTIAGASPGIITNAANARFYVASTSVAPNLTATASPNLVSYVLGAAQAVKAIIYHNLTIDKTIGTTASAAAAFTVNNDFTVLSGTFADATFLITGNATGTFTVGANGTYTTTKIATPWLPSTYGNGKIVLNATSTVNYNGGALHNIVSNPNGTATLIAYGHFGIAGSVAKTVTSTNISVNNLTINTGATLADGGNTVTVSGSISSNGTHSGAGRIKVAGGSAQTISITSANIRDFGNVEIANTSGGVSMAGTAGSSQRINGDLILNSGDFTVGAYTLILNGNPVSGTGKDTNLKTGTTSNLTFTGVVSGHFIPASILELNKLDVSNTHANGVAMNNHVNLNAGAGALNLGGRLVLGDSSLTLINTASTITGTPSSTLMVVATGNGYLKKAFPASNTASFVFPVGDMTGTIEYSPAAIYNFTPASVKIIGVKITDDVHTEMHTLTSQTNYLTRYWTFNEDNGAAYTYTELRLTYISTPNPSSPASSGDIIGTISAANTPVNWWDGTQWNEMVPGTYANYYINTTGTYTQVTGKLGGNDFTGRKKIGQAYVWLPTNGATHDFTDPVKWSPARNSPLVTDTLKFISGMSSIANNIPSQTVARVIVDGTTDISWKNVGSAATFTIGALASGNTGNNLYIGSGSNLQLSNTNNNNFILTFAAGTQTATIDGILTLNASVALTNNQFSTSATTATATVNSGGKIVNNGGTVNTGVATTLIFLDGSVYEHAISGGTIPTATYYRTTPSPAIDNSTVLVTFTSGTNVAITGINQIFSNFTFQSNAGASGVANSDMTVNRNATFTSGTFNMSSNATARTMTIGGSLITNGGFLNGSSSTANSIVQFTTTGVNSGGINLANTNQLANINIIVALSRTVDLQSDVAVATGRTFTNNGTLICNSYIISGAGTFTLFSANTATLSVSHADGINTVATGNIGNVQTAARNYGALANYIYRPTALETGTGFTAASTLTIDTANINLSAPASITAVSPTAALTCNTSLLKLGNNNLTFTATTNLLLGGTGGFPSASSMIVTNGDGYLVRRVAATSHSNLLYPVGVSQYSPITYNFSVTPAGTHELGVRVKEIEHPENDAADYLNRYWETSVVSNLATYTLTSVVMEYKDISANNDVTGDESKIIAALWTGSAWSGYTGSVNVSANTVTASGSFNQVAMPLNNTSMTGRLLLLQNYRTVTNGDWNNPATWEVEDIAVSPGTWAGATTSPDATNSISILIRNGHQVTVTADVDVDQLTIDNNNPSSKLTINSSKTFTLKNGTSTDLTLGGSFSRLAIDGILINQGVITGSTTGTTAVGATGVYEHDQDGGTVPTATWDAASLCKVTGTVSSTTLSGFSGQTFGHFEYESAGQTSAILLGMAANTSVRNFNMKSSNSGSVVLGTTASITLTINGDLNITGGILDMSNANVANTINLYGHYNQTGGTFTKTVGTNVSTLNFYGAANDYTQSAGSVNNAYINYALVGSGASLTLKNALALGAGTTTGRLFTVPGNTTLTLQANLTTFGTTGSTGVQVSGILKCGTYLIDGNGIFNLTSGATVEIGDPDGITQALGTATGNIRTTNTRTFSTAADYIYNGSGAQLTGTGLTTCNNLTVNNSHASGVLMNGNVTVTNQLTLVSNTGELKVGGNTLTLNGPFINGTGANTKLITTSASTLVYGTGSNTNTGLFIPGSVTDLKSLTIGISTSNTDAVTLNNDITLDASGVLTLTSGRLKLGTKNLTLNSTAVGAISGGSATAFVQADGSGQLKRNVATGNYVFPIGDNSGGTTVANNTGVDYSPVTLNFTANSTNRIIGIKVTDDVHPQYQSNASQTHYISRYWSFTDAPGTGTYTYTGTFNYSISVTPDLPATSTYGSVNMNRYESGWTEMVTTYPGAQSYGIPAVTEGSGKLNNNAFTGRVNAPQAYVWVPITTGPHDWQYPNNWSPPRISPFASDTLKFISGGSSIANNIPTQTIGSIIVSNAGGNGHTNISLQNVASSATLTIGAFSSGNTGNNLAVNTGSTLQLSNANANTFLLTFASGTQTATIDGILQLNAAVSFSNNQFTTTAATGTDGVTVNGSIINYGGTINSNTATLVFKNGSLYEHALNGGTIPTATWNSASLCKVSGISTFSPVAGFNAQTFGHFTWENGSQTGNISLALATTSIPYTTIAGNFNVVNTGSGSIILGTATNAILVVSDSLKISGVLDMSNANIANTINLYGPYIQTGGTFTKSVGTSAGTLNFYGATKDYIQSAGTVNNAFINYSLVGSGASLTLKNALTLGAGTTAGRTFTIPANTTLTQQANLTTFGTTASTGVQVSGTLKCGTFLVDGSGIFNLNSGATIEIGDPDGITQAVGTATGNIRTANTRTFSTGANYVYNGSAAQLTGTGLTTCNNLTFDNTNGVSLNGGNVVASNQLTITNGVVTLGGNNLTLNAGGILSISSPSSSKMILINGAGQFIRGIPNSGFPLTTLFPIGTSGAYTPASLTFNANSVAGTVGAKVTASAHLNIDLPGTSTDHIARYWSFTTPTGMTGLYNYTAEFGYLTTDMAIGSEANLVACQWNSPAWTGYTTTVTPNTPPTPSKLNFPVAGDLTESAAPLNGKDFTGRKTPILYYYRTKNSGDWDDVGVNKTWEISTHSGFTNPAPVDAVLVPTDINSLSITIRSPHTVTVVASVTADQVYIDATAAGTAALIINPSVTFTLEDPSGPDLSFVGANTRNLTINGKFVNKGQFTGTPSAISVNGEYEHAQNGGTIPAATWHDTSTCNITGVTSTGVVVGGLNQTFGNFIVNSGSSATMVANNNFTVKSNATFTNGTLYMSNSATPYTMTIGGGLITNGGVLDGSSSTASSTVQFTTTGINNGNINLANTNQLTDINITVGAGRTVTLLSNVAVDASRTFTNNGLLFCENKIISGSGTFTLANVQTATLGIGEDNGITTSGATGNIQTSTRTYNTQANLIYNGTNPQVTGNGLATAWGITNTTVTIDNTAGVTLSQSLSLNNNAGTGIILKTGLFKMGTSNLTIPVLGSVTSNPASTFSNAKMIVAEGTGGQLIKTFPTGGQSFTYPIGDNTSGAEYSPVTLNFTVLTGTAPNIGLRVTDTQHPQDNIPPVVDYITRFWTMTSTAIPTTYTFSGSLTYIAGTSDVPGTVTQTNLELNRYDVLSNNWVEYAANSSVTTPPVLDFSAITQANNFLLSTTAFDITARKDIPGGYYYQTITDGNWTNPAIWEVSTDPSFPVLQTYPAATYPNNANSFSIKVQANDTVTVSATTLSVDSLIVNGLVTVNAGSTFTVVDGAGTDMTVNGFINNSGTLTLNTANSLTTVNGSISNIGTSASISGTAATLIFDNSSFYNHQRDGGVIPTATYYRASPLIDNSTIKVTGIVSTVLTGLSGNVSNLEWDCMSQTVAQGANGALSIFGNLTVTQTGTGAGALTDGASLITGPGASSGKTFALSNNSIFTMTVTNANPFPAFQTYNLNDASTVNYNSNIAQNIYAVSGGYGILRLDNANTTAYTKTALGSFTIKGDYINGSPTEITFSLGANTITFNAGLSTGLITGSATSNMVFNGSGNIVLPPTITNGLGKLTVNRNGNTVTLPATTNLTVADTLRLSNGTLIIPASRTLTSNGTIISSGTGALSGISTSNLTVSTGGNASFGFAAGGQTLGTFIYNRSGVTLNLTSPLTVTILQLNNGVIDNGNNLLTVAGTNPSAVSGTGSVTTTGTFSSTTCLKGPLARTLPNAAAAGPWVFPIGRSYDPFELLSPVTTGVVVIRAEVFDGATGGTLGAGISAFNSSPARYWNASVVSGAANLTSPGTIRVTDDGVTIPNTKVLAQSSTRTGTYSYAGVGTGTTTISSAVPVNLQASPDSTYFTIGDKGTLCGTYTVGNSGSEHFKNLTAVAAALNALTVTCDVIFELTSNYVSTGETYPITYGNFTYGVGGPFTVTVRPATGVTVTVSGTHATTLIDLAGADKMIWDGRQAGTTNPKSLTISNTNTSGSTIRFINDAQNDTIRYCVLTGVNTSATNAVIWFSTASTDGNDNNNIDNCDIRETSTFPVNCIYSAGTPTTTTLNNSGNTISNNNIFNYYSASVASSGILLATGNTDWTISNNRFYQDASRSYTTAALTPKAISIQAGNNHSVSGNIIGFATNTGTGTYAMTSATTTRFIGIDLNVGTTTATSLQGNTISGMSLTTSSNASTANGVWCGINVTAGNVNVGTTTANTIGSGTGNSSILVTPSTTAALLVGINNSSTGTVNIQNNTIGSITGTGSAATVSVSITGIQATAGTLNVSNNTIGSTSTANSINSSTIATTGNQLVIGIDVTNGVTASATISGNTIAKLNQNGTTAGSYIRGISYAGTNAGTISDNNIYELSGANTNLGSGLTAGTIGILFNSSGNGHTVSNNKIHSLSNSAISAAVHVVGLSYSVAASGTNIVERNFIHSLSPATTNVAASISGIHVIAGNSDFRNNMVRVGVNAAGSEISTGYAIYGINEAAGLNNYYFNSIFIGGSSGVISSSNTFAFNSTVSSGSRNILNNIFFNARANASGSAKNYAMKVGGMTGLTTNYNDLLATGAGGIVAGNSTDYSTLVLWQENATGAPDARSFSINPLFIDAAGSAANVDLHIQASPVKTPIEGAGIDVVSVTVDFDGVTRSSTTPVDVGADAGNFDYLDLMPPVIAYTPILDNNSNTANPYIFSGVQITDSSGVNTTAGTKPRLYYKKSGDANDLTGWKYVEAANSSSPFTFNFDYTILNAGGVTVGDVIQYFVIAQDISPDFSYNVGINSGAFGNCPSSCPASVALGAGSFAINAPLNKPINSFVIKLPFDTIRVGTTAGYDFTSFTRAGGLFQAINTSTITTDLTILVISDITNEDGTHGLNQVSENPPGSNFLVTIMPDAGTPRTVSGSYNGSTTANAGLFRLNGADRVTVDGQDNLTFRNTNSATSAFNSTFNFINDASDNTITHCILEGASKGGSTIPAGVVLLSTAAISGTGNDDILIEYCDIRGITGTGNPAFGIVSVGTDTSGRENSSVTISNNNIYNFYNTSGISAGIFIGDGSKARGSDLWTITDNSFYQTEDVNAGVSLNYRGMSIQHTANSGFIVSNNFVGGRAPQCGGSEWKQSGSDNTFIGILLSGGSDSASTVQNNTIRNINISSETSSTENAGISVPTGRANIGTSAGNLVGSTDLSSDKGIIFQSSGNAPQFTGISVGTGGSSTQFNVLNNTVAGITLPSGSTVTQKDTISATDVSSTVKYTGQRTGNLQTTVDGRDYGNYCTNGYCTGNGVVTNLKNTGSYPTNTFWGMKISPSPAHITGSLLGAPNSQVCATQTGNLTYNSSAVDRANGVAIFTGQTNYRVRVSSASYPYTWTYTDVLMNTRLTVTVTTSAGSPVPLVYDGFNNLLNVPYNQELNVRTFMETKTPPSRTFFTNPLSVTANGIPYISNYPDNGTISANTWYPSIYLYDKLHTDPGFVICTGLEWDFYTNGTTTQGGSTGLTPTTSTVIDAISGTNTTVTNTSPYSTSIGRAGGATLIIKNSNYGAIDASWGISTTVPNSTMWIKGDVDRGPGLPQGNNNLPPNFTPDNETTNCPASGNMVYQDILADRQAGKMIFTGTTSFVAGAVTTGSTNIPVNTRLTITVTNKRTGNPVTLNYNSGVVYTSFTDSLKVVMLAEASPTATSNYYCGGTGACGLYTIGTYYPVIEMYNTISTATNKKICTGVNWGFYTNGTSTNVIGILTANGVTTISNNTISTLTSDIVTLPTSTSTFGITGISVLSPDTGQTVSDNTIHTLTAASTIYKSSVVGINFASAATTGINVVKKNFIHSFSTDATDAVQIGINAGNGVAEFSNNVIRLGIRSDAVSVASSAVITGIMDASSSVNANFKFYYNSVYIGGTGVFAGTNNTYGFQRNPTYTSGNDIDTIENNIFMNDRDNASGTGINYGVYLDKEDGIMSNYNLVYGSGNGYIFGGINGTDYSDLAAWQAAGFYFDTSSVEGNPLFSYPKAATPDLHIDTLTVGVTLVQDTSAGCMKLLMIPLPGNSPAEGKATPLGTVNIDIDIETRNATTPDIGADEFTNCIYGAGVWTGNGGDDQWFNAANWSCNFIPDSSTYVIIPGGRPFYPASYTATAACSTLAIIDDGQLTLTGGFALDVGDSVHIDCNASLVVTDTASNIYLGGNWHNFGTFTHGNGKVIFDGTVSSTVLTNNQDFARVDIDKSGLGFVTIPTTGEDAKATLLKVVNGELIVESLRTVICTNGDVEVNGKLTIRTSGAVQVKP